MAISAASAGLNYMGQQKNAKASMRAQAQYNEALARNARENANRQYEQLQEQREQQIDQQKDVAEQERKKVLQALARQRVSSGEAGVAGLSVDQLLAEFDREVGRIESVTMGNIERIDYQAMQEAQGVHARAKGQPYDLTPIAQPSIAAPLMQVAGDAFQGYRDFLYVKPSS
jgi:multidrug efflux pump subunit AcrA (membrane-fusion protein)